MNNVMNYKDILKHKITEYNRLQEINPKDKKLEVLFKQYKKLRDWEWFEKTGRWR